MARLANRAQRRALRGLYQCCSIPGCTIGDDRCKLHHTNIHHDGWIIELGPNRELTLRLPDDTIHTTGPPNQRTAA